MSTLLIMSPTQTDTGIQNWNNPHIGINRIAQYVENNSEHKVIVHDSALDGDVDTNLFKEVDFIGFSLLDYTFINDLKLINLASQINPNAILIAGGISATLDPETLLLKSKIDYIVQGYGEKQTLAIMNREHNIPGVIHRCFTSPITSQELTDWYMDMDFKKLRYEEFWDKTAEMYENPNRTNINTIRLVTTSHCNMKCSFCSARAWAEAATGETCKPAMLSAESLIKLTQKIIGEVPSVKTIYLGDDDCLIDLERFKTYMRFTETTGLRYLIQTHSSRIKDEAIVQMLAKGGVQHISLGIESVIPRILKTMNKTNTLERLPDFIEWCKRSSITPYFLIILFCQFITLPELIETVRILKDYIERGATISIVPNLLPFKGASLRDNPYTALQETLEVGPGVNYKQEHLIWCEDPEVRKIQEVFNARRISYIEEHTKIHKSKDIIGIVMLNLLDEILEDYH